MLLLAPASCRIIYLPFCAFHSLYMSIALCLSASHTNVPSQPWCGGGGRERSSAGSGSGCTSRQASHSDRHAGALAALHAAYGSCRQNRTSAVS